MKLRTEATIEPTDVAPDRYLLDPFVARYAAVWAYGVVGRRMSERYYNRLLALAADSIRATGARQVLDVGCGPGAGSPPTACATYSSRPSRWRTGSTPARRSTW